MAAAAAVPAGAAAGAPADAAASAAASAAAAALAAVAAAATFALLLAVAVSSVLSPRQLHPTAATRAYYTQFAWLVAAGVDEVANLSDTVPATAPSTTAARTKPAARTSPAPSEAALNQQQSRQVTRPML